MKCFRSITALILLSAATQLWAADKPQKAPPTIFESFRLLDNQFTRLDAQFHDLQRALSNHASQAKMNRDRQHATREMRATIVQIRRLSYRMYKRYHGDRSLGRRMFVRLHSRASQLQARLQRVSRAQSQKLARGEEAAVAKAMLDLVLQYQALSGGYAAATCNAGAWSCGVEKKEARMAGYPTTGVKWTCVKQRASCHGILGPRAPMLTEPPLTANAH